MNPVVVGIIGFAILIILMALRMPIGLAMLVVGTVGIWYLLSGSAAVAKMAIVPFDVASRYDFSVLPAFLLMAYIIIVSGLGRDLYSFAAKWLGHLPGGLAIATVAGCAIFGAVSASGVATVTTMSQLSIPEMKRHKYGWELITGSVVCGATIDILIPPSGLFIIYGIMTETSIGELFIGGIVPGIILTILYILTINVICWRNPAQGPRGPRSSFREKINSIGNCGEIIGLIIFVLGGIIIGWFTPTEAGAVGAFGAIIFCLIRKRLNGKKFKQAVIETLKSTGMVYLILIGAMIFSYFTAVSTIASNLADFVAGLSLPPMGVMAIMIVIYILLGTVMDEMTMVFLTIPIFFPLAMSLGFDPIWFGIMISIMVMSATISPPMGLNIFIVSALAKDVPLTTIYKGTIPFMAANLVLIALLLFFPNIVLFLPSLMR